MRQIRRARPTFQTAHQFHQDGIFGTGPEHFVEDEERGRFCDEISETLLSLIKNEFPRTSNLEYAILKAHLIVEYALTQYIRGMSRVLVDEAALKRFTFAHKLEIAYLMGFGAREPTVIPSVERLNKIRNQVAHSFAIDRHLFDEMIRVNSEDYSEFAEMTDRVRVRRLRGICALMTGRIAGELQAHLHFSIIDEERSHRQRDGA